MIITFFPNGSDLKGIRGWDALQSIGKKWPPTKSSLLTCSRTCKFLATTLWVLDLTAAKKTSATNKLGYTRNAHIFVVPKRRMHNGIGQISKLLLSVDSNQSLKNKKIDDLYKTLATNRSTSKEKKLMKKKQGQIGCSQGKTLFVMFKLIYRR